MPIAQKSLVLMLMLLSGCASVDPGPRAIDLAQDLSNDRLKSLLLACSDDTFEATPFSISHRGAPLGYPEHTKEGYLAAARMGAGVIECDVTFTKDLELVCRHSQCDLHRTTNVLTSPLAANCSEPFQAATQTTAASAKCCTSDFTLDEFKSLCGRRDLVDPRAHTIADYLAEPPSPVVDNPLSCGTLMTHGESIRLIDRLGRRFTPELKRPEIELPFGELRNQSAYADRLIADYLEAGIAPDRVYPQSFNLDDIKHWIAAFPDFGASAVYLDGRTRDETFVPTLEGMRALKASGVNIIAPPIPALLEVDDDGELAPTRYAELAKAAGLEIITWTFESRMAELPGFVRRTADTLEVLDALHAKVGVKGVFSDWPGTVTYYANCVGAMGETKGSR